MTRKAGYIYVEVGWDLTNDEGHRTPSMKQAGVSRIATIPVSEFNDRYDEAPEDWVADWLSDKYGWCVNGWRFA